MASGLTGPMAASSASSCATRSAGSTPSGSSGAGAPRASSGPQPSSRRRVSTTDSRRTVASTRSSSAFCSRLRVAASSCSLDRPLAAQLLQAGPAGPDGLELAAVTVPQRRQQGVEAGLRLGHHAQEPLDGGGVGLEARSALGRLLALLGVSGQPALHLGQPLGQHPAALDQTGRAHLPLGRVPPPPRRCAPRSAGAPRGPPPPARPPRTRSCSRAGMPGHQLGHPGGVTPDAVLELGPVASDLLELGGEQVAVAGHPLAADPGRLVGHLVAVVGPHRLRGRLAGRLHLGPGHACARRRPAPPRPVATSARSRASSTTAAVTTPPPARTRHPVGENRSPSRVTTTRSGRDRARSMASDQPRRAQHEPSSRVSRTPSSPGKPRPPGPRSHVATDRLGARRRRAGPPRRARRTAAVPVRASTAPVAPPWRSRDRAARAGSLPDTTTAASEAPAAASKASSHPLSTSTRSSRVPTTPSTPASSSAPAAPRASSSARSRASARAWERACSCSAWRRASSATSSRRVAVPVGRLGGGTGGLQTVTVLLRLGQALTQLVVLALEEGGTPFGRTLAGHELVEGPAVALERVLQRGELPPGDRHGLLGPAEFGAVAPGGQVRLELGRRCGLRDGEPRPARRPGPSTPGSAAASSSARRAPSASSVETTSASAAASRARASDRCRSRSTPGEAPGPLDHALGPAEGGGQVGLALGRQLVGRALRVGVEFAQCRLELHLTGTLLLLEAQPLGTLAVEGAELGAGHVEPHGPQLVGQAGVGPGGGGLALERADLALHFPDQVEQALQVLLGGRPAGARTAPGGAGT